MTFKKALVITAVLAQGSALAGNLDRSKLFFDQLSADRINLVDQFYDTSIVFQDPVHKLSGLSELKKYYQGLYKNVDSIRFEYGKGIESTDTVSMPWKMLLKTPAINGGKEISVDGVSVITFNPQGKAILHRDYFDMGEFVYERIPILRSVVFYIKSRLSNNQ